MNRRSKTAAALNFEPFKAYRKEIEEVLNDAAQLMAGYHVERHKLKNGMEVTYDLVWEEDVYIWQTNIRFLENTRNKTINAFAKMLNKYFGEFDDFPDDVVEQIYKEKYCIQANKMINNVVERANNIPNFDWFEWLDEMEHRARKLKRIPI